MSCGRKDCTAASPIDGRSLLMRVGADALAKRVRRSRTGRLQSWEPAAANNDDPACLAVGETSAGFDTGTVVPSKGPVQWRPNPEGTDRCLGPKAADRLLEICDRRDRTGRSRDSGCLSTSAPQSSGARSAPADPGERTEIWPGSKSRKREWFRSPEPSPDASGIWCSRQERAATGCEFEAASATSRVMQMGSDLGYEATTGESYHENLI